jgi:uracil-DNA glycosylase
VTGAALTQCVTRHLEPIVKRVAPQAIVAMGGPAAAYFWQRAINSWKAWRPIEQLHGKTLAYYFEGRSIPVVLSVHPYQRDIDLHPEAIARALSACLRPEDLQPRMLQAA